MEEPLSYLKQRANESWLIGEENTDFYHFTIQLFQQLTQFSSSKIPPTILLSEPNHLRFLAAFLAAVAANCPVFLCNPNWKEREWQQIFELIQPDLIFGQVELPHQCNTDDTDTGIKFHNFLHLGNGVGNLSGVSSLLLSHSGLIMIPTGGSSGKIRFAIHTWETLMASVRGFYHYFGNKSVNSFCVLPLYHVSGLMQFLRSFTTGGTLIIKSFKQVESGEKFEINPEEFFISLVPTQLQRCLQNPHLTYWLSQFQTVLLGGAPAGLSLLEQARNHTIRLAPTYGMTETASQIVTLKPEDFLAGNNSCGQILPHAHVTIRDSTDKKLPVNQTGIITIQADSLALGYYPIAAKDGKHSSRQNLKSDDLGFFDQWGYLHIRGRSNQKIITGGENVFPTEVEDAIQATQLVSDVCVMGIPDLHWGQVVTAIYVPQSKTTSRVLLATAINDKLSKYKQPKHWVAVEQLPRNAQGKVDYKQLQNIVMTKMQEIGKCTP